MRKKPPQITIDELRKELEILGVDLDDTQMKTTLELSQEWGCGVAKVRRLLHKAKQHGKLVVGVKKIETLTGGTKITQAYRIV